MYWDILQRMKNTAKKSNPEQNEQIKLDQLQTVKKQASILCASAHKTQQLMFSNVQHEYERSKLHSKWNF